MPEKRPKTERYVYVAEFNRGEPLMFRNSSRALAYDHAYYVGWQDGRTVKKIRRATPEEVAAFEKEWS